MIQINSFDINYEWYGIVVKEFNWKGVDLNLLVAFQALYQSNSVSIAAERSHVSQSAMSHTLQRLRQLINDPLFERVGTRMEPTVRANELAPFIDTLLESVKSELFSQEGFSAIGYKGVCKLGLTDYAEQLFAPTLFDTIIEQAPNCQVSFFNVNRSNYDEVVDKENLDVVIGSIDNLNSRFVSEHLYTEQHLCLFDPSSVDFADKLTLKEFASVDHALVSPDGSLETKVDRELQRRGYSRRVAVASRHFLTVRRLLIGRKLICLVPKRFAETEVENHSLRVASPPVEIADFDIQMLYLKSNRNDKKNEWLRKTIANTIQ